MLSQKNNIGIIFLWCFARIAALFLCLSYQGCIPQYDPPKPRILIFGATWCPYCPTESDIQKLANDFPTLEVQHIDVDENKALAEQYHIKTLPTFIVCTDKGCLIFHTLQEVRKWLAN